MNKLTLNERIEDLQFKLMYARMFFGPQAVASQIEELDKLKHIRKLWQEFGVVPMDPDTECLEEEWHGFPAETNREDIWHWFEKEFRISVTELMYDSPRKPVTINDMIQYGYTWLGMVPMHAKQARRFFDSGKYCVFRLYPDGTEAEVFYPDELTDDFIYGVEYNQNNVYEWLFAVLPKEGLNIWTNGKHICCRSEKLRNQLAKLFDDKDYYFECGYQKMSSDCQDCICGYLPNNRYYWIRAWKE